MAAQCRAIFEAGGHRGLDPFGYRTVPGSRPRTLEPVAAEVEVVARIWAELVSRSTAQIAEGLDRDDVRHRVERPWTRDAVEAIARRGRFYLGYVTHRRGLEERPGRHPAIIDEETWRDGVAGMRRRVRGVVQRSSRHRTYLLAGLLHCGSCGKRLHGQAATSRGREWRYYRCRGCSASAVVADVVEGELCERISEAVLPANIIELAREQLRERLALPRDDGKLRRRLEQRRERLGQLFAWGDLTEAVYRRQRAEVERDLALLPDDDKLVLFDRHRGLMVSMAENVAAATPEQLRELILMLVERAETWDRGLGPVRWTGPARPFFAVVGVAPPDGFEPPTRSLGRCRSIH